MNHYTEIVVIIDRSGSMGHLTNDTVGGYNEFIKAQKALEGDAKLTTVIFDNEYEVIENCHSLTSTFGRSNKAGNGRRHRGLRS